MSRLLSMFVEFTAKGQETVKAAMEGIRQESAKIQASIESVGRVSSVIYAQMAAHIGGYIRQGVAASNVGDQLALQTQRISLAMSGLFRPEL